MKNFIYDFYKGMSNVIDPKNLPDGMAALIQNMTLDEDGTYKAIPTPTVVDTPSYFDTAAKIFQWFPNFLPTGCVDTYVFVVFYSSTVRLVYRTATTPTWGQSSSDLFSGISSANVQASSDANQFVFVDGRVNNVAKRIIVNDDGTVTAGNLGCDGTYILPTLKDIVYDSEDNIGTRIGQGGVYYYLAVFVNKYGERSKPTPVLVVDGYQYQQRGKVDSDGNYLYDYTLRGSLRSVTITVNGITTGTEKVELYRADAYGTGAKTPRTVFRIVTEKYIGKNDTSTDIVDTYPYGLVEIDYDKGVSPCGDDILATTGNIFIANAVKAYTFPYTINKIWEIKLTNPNVYNYVNQFIMLDMQDNDINFADTGYFSTLKVSTEVNGHFNKYRFMDSDLITALETYTYGYSKTITNETADIATNMYVFIKVPYIPAGATHSIYLVETTTTMSTAVIPREFSDISADAGTIGNLYYGHGNDQPVRDENTLLCVLNGEFSPILAATPSNYILVNKANKLYAPDNFPTTLGATPFPLFYDEYAIRNALAPVDTAAYYAHRDAGGWTYNTDGIFMNKKGYAYIWGRITEGTALTKNILRLSEDDLFPRIELTITDNGTDTLTWGMTTTTDSPATAVIVNEATLAYTSKIDISFFVLISWQNTPDVDNPDNGLMKTALFVAHSADATVLYGSANDTEVAGFNVDGSGVFRIVVFGDHSDAQLFMTSKPYVAMGEYLNSKGHLKQLNRYLPIFPDGYIGIDYTKTGTISGNTYYQNQNVVISKITRVNDTTPGRMYWTSRLGLLGFNEQYINEEIMRIFPLKSIQLTDEHNTIIIFGKTRTWEMALFGDNDEIAKLTILLNTIGISNRNALAATDRGVVWCNDDDVHMINNKGYKLISDGRIDNLPADTLVSDPMGEMVWLISASAWYLYDIKNNIWTAYSNGTVIPRAFIYHIAKRCFIGAASTAPIYGFEPSPVTYLPSIIKSRAYRIGRHNKIKTVTIHGTTLTDTVKYKLNLSGTFTLGTQATLTTNLTGHTNNDLVFTARRYGTYGNSITVQYLGGTNMALAVTVTGTAIVVQCKTSGTTIDTKASDIKTAIEANFEANLLVTVANKAGNDGSGLVEAMGATPLAGAVDTTIISTSEYSAKYEKPHAPINAKAEYVQIEMSNTSYPPNNVTAIELEI